VVDDKNFSFIICKTPKEKYKEKYKEIYLATCIARKKFIFLDLKIPSIKIKVKVIKGNCRLLLKLFIQTI
jgi:hypothetical protein